MRNNKASDKGVPWAVAGDERSSRNAKRILIAYDGSAGADSALADLGHAGLPDDLEALVLSVAEKPARENPTDCARGVCPSHQAISRAAVSLGQRLAEQACCRLQFMFPRWRLESVGITDSPVGGIVRMATEREVDLVVVGAHGLSGFERMLLGSVARRVFAQAPCSIRIARPRLRPPGPGPRIVVAVGDSSDDERVIGEVAARRWPAAARFQIVTVVDARLAAARASARSFASAWRNQHSAVVEARACQLVEHYRNRLCRAGLTVEILVFEEGLAGRVVPQASAWEADGVFLGHRGAGRGEGRIVETAAFTIAACAPCSVEVIRGRTQIPDSRRPHLS